MNRGTEAWRREFAAIPPLVPTGDDCPPHGMPRPLFAGLDRKVVPLLPRRVHDSRLVVCEDVLCDSAHPRHADLVALLDEIRGHR